MGGIQKRAPQDVTTADTALDDACPCEVSSGSGEARSQAVPPRPHPSQQSALVDLQVSLHHDTGLTLDAFKLDEATLVNSPILPYLAMVATVIEGRVIGVEELLHVLRRSMRQRSFDRLPRREYVLGFLNQHPP